MGQQTATGISRVTLLYISRYMVSYIFIDKKGGLIYTMIRVIVQTPIVALL